MTTPRPSAEPAPATVPAAPRIPTQGVAPAQESLADEPRPPATPETPATPEPPPFPGHPSGVARHVPVVGWLPSYRTGGLWRDALAGLVVAALAIPQSMGYAAVAGVGVEVGLYTLPPALLAYAIFGSSRLLVVGPVSTVSLLSGSLVAQMSGGDPVRAAALTSALAVAAGVVLVIAGLFRIGWVAEFLSEPIVAGFITGLTVLVVLGQAPVLLGVRSGHGGVVEQFLGIAHAVGHEHPAAVLVSTVSLVVLFGGHRLVPQAPWSLLVLIGGVVASRVLDLHAMGVSTIGHVPSGLRAPVLPDVRAGDLPALLTGAAAVAMVGLAEGLAAARLLAQQHHDRIDTDQELIAHGAADLAAGLVGGMGAAGSLSKTAASERTGGRSQVVGMVAAVGVVLVMLLASAPMSALPSSVLASIVVHAVWGLVRPEVFRRYWAIRSNDGIAAVVAMIGVLALGPLLGLLIAIGQSVLGLVYRSTQVHIEEMGKLPEEKAAWGRLRHHPERRTVPGLMVVRLDSPLFWANAATVTDRLLEMVLARPDVRIVLLDLEATNQLDATTERRLESFITALRASGRDLYLVRLFHQVRVVMKKAGLFDQLGEGRTWHSIAAAVHAAKAVVAVEEAFDAASLEWKPDPPPDDAGAGHDVSAHHEITTDDDPADPCDPTHLRERADRDAAHPDPAPPGTEQDGAEQDEQDEQATPVPVGKRVKGEDKTAKGNKGDKGDKGTKNRSRPARAKERKKGRR